MDWKNINIGVLMGGWSAEREVSLNSGQNVFDALISRGYQAVALDVVNPDDLLPALVDVDIVFNCLHGGMGEDGTLHALFDVIGIPYTGSPMLACALAMDKVRSKQAFQHARLIVPEFVQGISPKQKNFTKWCKETLDQLSLPVVVKPVREGSSVGVHIIRDPADFGPACLSVAREYEHYMVETFIEGKEITAGILHYNGQAQALPLLELRPKRNFYDYQAKYTPGMTEFIIPATLDDATTKQVQTDALKAFEALDCHGFARVDFRVSEQNECFVLEVNTLPGMTNTSDLPQMAEAAGISFELLVEYILKTADKPSQIHQQVRV